MSSTTGDRGQWDQALRSLRAARLRPEIQLSEAPAPLRLAPQAVAVNADVSFQGEDLASGRLVVLHDPRGQEAWDGEFRVVAFVRATLEPEMAADTLLAQVGWTWLAEALEESGAGYRNISGTVTRVTSESFGGLSERPLEGQIEIRASWTPTTPDLGAHVNAWGSVLEQAAGLLPLPSGVSSLPRPRR